MNTPPHEGDELLTPSEVAAILYVDPKTVTRWAIARKVNSIRTPGGHRRFWRSEILGLLTGVEPGHAAPVDSQPGSPARAVTSVVADHYEPSPESVDVSALAAQQKAAATVAAAVVAEAVAIAREAMAIEVAQAATLTRHAVAAAANRAADAAQTARAERARAAAEAAEAVAISASRTAAALQLQADASALKLIKAAGRAAARVLAANPPGSDHEAALTAIQVAAIVRAAAVATAEEAAAAAAQVASAVTAAAGEVALRVSALDAAIESQVAKVAAAVQIEATATARQVASDTDDRASGIATLARSAVARSHDGDPRPADSPAHH